MKKKIYLASGWFNDNQERRVAEAEKTLRNLGFDVFSPREHQNPQFKYLSDEWREATFAGDVEHVDWSDFLFVIYDEEDAGTMWETGYAWAKGKPIIVFNETGGIVNLMISDSLTAYLTSWEEVRNYDFTNMPYKKYDGEVI